MGFDRNKCIFALRKFPAAKTKDDAIDFALTHDFDADVEFQEFDKKRKDKEKEVEKEKEKTSDTTATETTTPAVPGMSPTLTCSIRRLWSSILITFLI